MTKGYFPADGQDRDGKRTYAVKGNGDILLEIYIIAFEIVDYLLLEVFEDEFVVFGVVEISDEPGF